MDHVFLGHHPSIEKIRELVSMVSDTAFNVLLTGETGTGKEVVARLLHNDSSRRNEKFVKVNCAALPTTLLESELFGYEKGAFTGAFNEKPGKFELASKGVMFLDEIGDMPLVLQAKLLHVLQSGEFNRLGGTKDIKVDAWVIASTNHDLDGDIKAGAFREDLFYRLNIIKIELPPLRERRDDIALLTEYFVNKFRCKLNSGNHFRVGADLQDLFEVYHWPGNVRELSSVVLRLMVGDEPDQIKGEILKNMKVDGLSVPKALMPKPRNHSKGKKSALDGIGSLKGLKDQARRYIEKRTIESALDMTGWNKRQAARMLKISYKALFYKMDELGIERNPRTGV